MNASVSLLGAPQFERDGVSSALPREGPLWLVAFVACHDDVVSREEIIEVLYPDVEAGAARNRLRNLLHRTRTLEWTAGLEADARGLRWNADCDVRRFRLAFTQGDWAEAVRVYRGIFLEGCRVYDSPELETWLESERENLQAAWRDAALNHAASLQAAGTPERAMPILERALELDPYAEEAVQAYLRSAAGIGQRALAERVFGAFRVRLERDLGLEPEAATVRLYESLFESPSAGVAEPSRAPVVDRAVRGPRAPLTSFVGRESELEAVSHQLQNPECRLLTLTGPGGMGKTRLALEVLERARPAFAGEVYIVPLEAVSNGAMILGAIAEALGFSLAGAQSPQRQLAEFLGNRPRLLVLDNFEQLLTPDARQEALGVVLELLEIGTLKLLVTSRHRLELQSEWVVPLEGLPIPTSGTLEATRRSSGARLFVERASRVRPGFALDRENAPAVARICRLTDGLPLGIELAAAWVGAFEPEEIAAELEAHADLERAPASDRPERHHSLRAAFEHSWQLLSTDERDALARLSVFRGGFERAGAARVASSALRALLGLVNKSLLRRTLEGRFVMLEVIRQHAAERLHRTPAIEAEMRRAHAEYALELIEELEPELHGPDQARIFERLEREHDNARGALQWAFETGSKDAALRLACGLFWFWYVRGHHREGRALLETALAMPGPEPDAEAEAHALRCAGMLAMELGDYAEAQHRLERALGLWRALGQRARQAEALYGLGVNASETGDLEMAQSRLEAAVSIQREVSDRWGLSTSLNDLGYVRMLLGDRAAARRDLEESLQLKETIGDVQGVAYALTNLSLTVEDDVAAGRVLTARSLAIKRELGDRQGMANSLYNLGLIDLHAGDLEAARSQLSESLGLFWQLGRRRAIAAALAAHAQLCALEGRFERCARLDGAVDALVRASGFQLQGVNLEELEAQLGRAREALGEALYAQAQDHGQRIRLEEAVALALEPPNSPPGDA